MKTKTTILRSRATEAFMELRAVNVLTIEQAKRMLPHMKSELERAMLLQLILMNRNAHDEVGMLLDGITFDDPTQLRFWEGPC